MNTITSINDLKKYTLSLGDTVIFNINNNKLQYEVCSDHLKGQLIINDRVFSELGITPFEKYEFASKIYGYQSSSGSWPSCREDDFKSLTELVKFLYMIIEAKNKHDGTTSFNMFETVQNYFSKDTSEKSSDLKLSDLKLSKLKIKHIAKDKESQLKRIK